MNGTSGFDLVKWLRVNRPDTAVLLISGYPHPSVDEVLEEIDVPFLKKPFRPEVLASKVRQVLDARVASMKVC